METVIMFKGDEPHEVERANVQAALDSGLEPAAEFLTPDNQKHIVRQRDYDAAFSKGLKPANMQEQSFWESFKQGAKRGWDVFASSETGESPERTSLEQSQAWSENPVSYGAGVVAGMAPAVLGGAAAIGGAGYAAKRGMQAAQPYKQAAGIAAKEAYKETMASPTIPDVVGVTKPLAAGISAARAAVKQVPEVKREMADLAKLERRDVSREAGGVGAQGQRLYLGQELLEPGASPEKAAIAERAATLAPSNLRADLVQRALEMGTTRRHQAGNFFPEVAAEEVTPQLKEMQKGLLKRSGEYYRPLHEQAATQYKPEQGRRIPNELKYIRMSADETEGVSAQAKKALDLTQQIIEIAPSLYQKRGLSVMDTPWEAIEPQEQYKRIQAARQVLNQTISQMASSQDKTILNEPSRNALERARESLNAVLKSFPSQRKADEAFSAAKDAMGGLFEAMEYGKGDKKRIDVPAVKKLFGNNDKAYRIQEGIDTMRQFLAKFGNDIAPQKRAEMEGIVNRFDELRKQAEDKRLLEGLRQAQGPTSPAVERFASLREAKGLPSNIFEAPATALNAADEFMARRSSQYFNKNFEQLNQDSKNKLIRLLMWRQQNPNATMTDEESMFKKIMKARK